MVQELARSVAREKIAPVAAHHAETETYPEEPMRLLAQQGLMTSPEDVIVTSGAQQAIELVVRLLSRTGRRSSSSVPRITASSTRYAASARESSKCRSNLTAWTSKNSKRIWRATGRV